MVLYSVGYVPYLGIKVYILYRFMLLIGLSLKKNRANAKALYMLFGGLGAAEKFRYGVGCIIILFNCMYF